MKNATEEKIAVLVSGNGSNLQAIIDGCEAGIIPGSVGLVLADNSAAYALTRARKAGIETIVLDPAAYGTRQEHDCAVIKALQERGITFVALAGYMRVLSPVFVEAYPNRILNIHPSLLPAFKGTHGIRDAFDYGVKVTGVTVHLVDDQLDHGPVVLQESVVIEDADTLETLEKKIHAVEHRLYPEALRICLTGEITVSGRNVRRYRDTRKEKNI